MIRFTKRRCLLVLLLAWIIYIFSYEKIPQTSLTDKDQRVLLLTAHPDDECMFFAPTIRALVLSGVVMFSLCLSVGNADGLGETRPDELRKSLQVLGIPPARSAVVDHPNLQDNITQVWDPDSVAEVVRPYVRAHDITTILTFDTGGISGHPNHVSLPLGASHLLRLLPYRPIQLYTLKTVSLLPKYIGPFAHLAAKIQTTVSGKSNHLIFVGNVQDYATALRAMYQHWSQFVWFRGLYVLFSQYMWVNEWVPVQVA